MCSFAHPALALLFLLVIGKSAGVLVRGLDGPGGPVERGGDIALHCRFDLHGDQLYAVKWFRGTREFFRYQPQLVPPVRLFPIDDVRVDLEASNGEKLVIRRAVAATSGVYRCEVSAEETFETHYREINITVLDERPMGEPVIYNIQSRYRVGDELRINCTSFEPGATLSWHLNGDSKNDVEVVHYPATPGTSRRAASSLETATSVGLHIRRLTPGHFRHGQLTLSCTARLGPSHRSSTTVKAALDPTIGAAAAAADHDHERRQPTGPVVNRLRPSADADKRASSAPNLTGSAWPLIVILLSFY